MNKRILVLEDDEAISDVLREALTVEQFDVKIIASTFDIIGEVKMYRPHLVLVDYLLPEINGGELCHQIKSNPATRSIPVVMLSAYPRVLNSLGDYGWDAFIEKPFDLWELIDRLKTFLDTVTYE